MDLNRRKLFSELARAGGIVSLGGAAAGAHLVRQFRNREQTERKLIEQITPILTEKAQRELLTLPVRAREEMRRYFHGVCLNVHGFVTEICSVRFGESLRSCATQRQQRGLLTVAFHRKVVTDSEVQSRVETVAHEVGQELDQAWFTCCRKITDEWKVSLGTIIETESTIETQSMSGLAESLEPKICRHLEAARKSTYPLGQRPALSETAYSIGKSALLLLPMVSIAPHTAIPLFLIAASKPIWDYVLGQLNHRVPAYQRAITSRLSLLGNRVGVEFERETKHRIADLQIWQEQVLSETATRQAAKVVPLFF